MKKLLIILSILSLTACGYSIRDAELVGQVKKVITNTPLFCPNYIEADISLGVIRNGVGSMSTQDIWVVVNKGDAEILKSAAENGEIVKINYDEERLMSAWCTSGRKATSVAISK